MLVLGAISSPDFAQSAEAMRPASAARVVRSMSSRREKNPSITSRSFADNLASAGAGSTTRRCGGGIGDAVANHQSPRDHVAKPLMALAQEDHHDPQRVKARHPVDETHQVARQ